MKKKIITVIVAMVFLECVILLYRNNVEKQNDSFQISADNEELLASSREGYNSVVIYKQDNLLVVNAESDAVFFDGVQFTIETQGEVKSEDIQIIWTTLGGGTESTEDNDFIIAEIKICENDTLIVDTKINFAKKVFDAVEDVLER